MRVVAVWSLGAALILVMAACVRVAGDGTPDASPTAAVSTPVASPTATLTPRSTDDGRPSGVTPETTAGASTTTPTPDPSVPAPTAAFDLDLRAGLAPLLVRFTSTSTGPVTDLSWTFGDGSTGEGAGPVHRYERAGTYTVTLVASGPGGFSRAVLESAVIVGPGAPAELLLTPANASVGVGLSRTFSAVALDEFRNRVRGNITWDAAEGGSIDATGTFRAGTEAGVFLDAVRATFTDGTGASLNATASVVVEPGPPATIDVSPDNALLDVGETQTFSVDVRDSFGNVVQSPVLTWQTSAGVGIVSPSGTFTAGTKAGSFADGLEVSATSGNAQVSASADISIRPGPVAEVRVTPARVILREEPVSLTAAGFDEHGNEIPDLAFAWSGNGQVTVSPAGIVTGGGAPGVHFVEAQASFRGRTASATVAVAIPPATLESGRLESTRSGHVATLMPDGRVLLSGGAQAGSTTAEVFDPALDQTVAVIRLGEPRASHTATLLPDGRVLIVGGCEQRTMEIVDLDRQAATLTAAVLPTARANHTATPLPSGLILIAGGRKDCRDDNESTQTALLYDPETDTLRETGRLLAPRHEHQAALLPDGTVALVGGVAWQNGAFAGCSATVEVYDPDAEEFRETVKASALAGICGLGSGAAAPVTATGTLPLLTSQGLLVLDPSDGSFPLSTTLVPEGKAGRPATVLLQDSRLLVAGGFSMENAASTELLLVDLSNGAVVQLEMRSRRDWHTATLLPSGNVLLTGGSVNEALGPTVVTDSVELFVPR